MRFWQNTNAVLTLAAATVLILMVGIVAAIILDQYAKIHQAYSTYQEHAEQDRRDTGQEIAQACVGVTGGAFSECVVNKLEAFSRDQATNQDLQAQQDMAFWALCAFAASCATVLITAIGVFYVRKTLEASYLAVKEAAQGSRAAAIGAKAALDSVKQARDANRIARDSVSATREIGRNQARAYMLATKCKITKSHDGYRVTAYVVNNGQTPAIDVKIRVGADVVPVTRQDELMLDLRGDFRELGTWAAGVENHTVYEPQGIRSHSWLETPFPDPVATVSGTIRYTDIFGFIFETDFGFKANKLPGNELWMTPQSANIRSFECIGDAELGIWSEYQEKYG